MIGVIINVFFLGFLFLLCYPTYQWSENHKIKNHKIAILVSFIVYLVIINSLFELRSDLFSFFHIKDYGVEYN